MSEEIKPLEEGAPEEPKTVEQLETELANLRRAYDALEGDYYRKINSFGIRNDVNPSEQPTNWQLNNTLKGRYMYMCLSYKDTSSRMRAATLSDALNVILKVAHEANKLNHDQTTLHFADRDVEISDVQTLSIFQGIYIVSEISDDFTTRFSRKYKPTLCIDYGYPEGTPMPTVRQYTEALHVFKNMFKYMTEVYTPLSNYHVSVNVQTAMKECAHRSSSGTFYVARRENDAYFIPYYIEELNNHLSWSDEFYCDFASRVIDEYFDKHVFNILKNRTA